MSPRPFRLLLLRHGQTHANVAGALDTGHPGLDLTDLGRTQAAAAARALAGHTLDGLYVSRLVRTHQTVDPLARQRGLRPTELAGLHEIAAGDYEMATDRDSVHGYISTVARWIEGRLELRMPGGETGHEFLARYDADVEQIAAAGHDAALLVSHGAAIRAWVATRLGDLAGGPDVTQPLHNTALITLEGHPALGWRLVDWHGDPVGGHFLEDESAPDPTGEPAG